MPDANRGVGDAIIHDTARRGVAENDLVVRAERRLLRT